MFMRLAIQDGQSQSLPEKLREMPWGLLCIIWMAAAVGFAMLYSAGNGDPAVYAKPQAIRFGVGMAILLTVALIDMRLWLRHAYALYLLSLALLVGVEFAGYIGKGSQRWLPLGFFNLQPSELMKVTLVLALARYYNNVAIEDIGKVVVHFPPILMAVAPVFLVLRQPDLGTAMMLLMVAAAIMFVVGVRMWKFGLALVLAIGAIPIAWQFLHAYQKKRVLTFLNPEQDPLGDGYHIIQSKIALGSGGLSGKGFMQGTQSHLNFLPETQTDFIFTMLAEEFGLIGAVGLVFLYAGILIHGFYIAYRCRSQFGRVLAIGVTANFFLYVFINIAMVIGLIPVVGVPLPLISWGGTALLTVLLGFGFLANVAIHREVRVGKGLLGSDA